MKEKKTKSQTAVSLTAFLTQNNSTELSPCEKNSLTKLLIKSLLPEDECHKYKNRPYELQREFQHIAKICFELKEKSAEKYHTIHRIFLRISKKDWDKVSFFDISDMLAILLSTVSPMPEDLKVHLQEIRKLLLNLDYLYLRYPNLYFSIFSRKKTEEQNAKKEKLTENSLKEEILLSLCVFDKKDYQFKNDIDYITRKTNKILENPYIA